MIQLFSDATGELFEYTQVARLDGADFKLKLSWNERIDHWVLSVWDAADTEIRMGQLVVNGIDLLRGSVVGTKPPGRLFAAPLDESQAHADLTGLGSRVALFYVPEADLA